MLRAQISLTVEERQLLDAEAARTGRSMSSLTRNVKHFPMFDGLSWPY